MKWIMFQQIAPTNDDMEWAVGYLNLQTGAITSISWYYTENEARVAHHRLMF